MQTLSTDADADVKVTITMNADDVRSCRSFLDSFPELDSILYFER